MRGDCINPHGRLAVGRLAAGQSGPIGGSLEDLQGFFAHLKRSTISVQAVLWSGNPQLCTCRKVLRAGAVMLASSILIASCFVRARHGHGPSFLVKCSHRVVVTMLLYALATPRFESGPPPV